MSMYSISAMPLISAFERLGVVGSGGLDIYRHPICGHNGVLIHSVGSCIYMNVHMFRSKIVPTCASKSLKHRQPNLLPSERDLLAKMIF